MVNIRTIKHWTEEEKIFLKENFLKFGNIELGKSLGRSSNAISMRLYMINLSRPKEWNYERMSKNNPMFNKKTAKKAGLTRKEKYASGEIIHPMLGKKCPETSKRLKENNPMNDPLVLKKAKETIIKLRKEGKIKLAIRKGETLEDRYGIKKARKIRGKLSKARKGKRTGEDNSSYAWKKMS